MQLTFLIVSNNFPLALPLCLVMKPSPLVQKTIKNVHANWIDTKNTKERTTQKVNGKIAIKS